MAVILQVNLDGTVLAHDLLDQFSRARGVDSLFINESSRTLSGWGWYCDRTGCATILIRSDKFPVSNSRGGDGFVRIRSGRVFYVSCYIFLNISIGVLRGRLAELEDTICVCRENGDLVLAGDFNSKAISWGEPRTDSRGRAVLEMAARLDLIVMNSGSLATFRRTGNRGTIIDFTLASSQMAARVSDWQVLEDYTASYHQNVSFTINEEHGTNLRGVPQGRAARWNVAKLNRDLLREAMTSAPPYADLYKITNAVEVEALVEGTMRHVKEWCDTCMPKRTARRGWRSCC
ncbi:uncharacterized protein LOC106641412 [Copidosoma floridanum]|uniref:uncharacterized protein LOC106641412 n=1 Tax=Copidosoma floridanum TaxID=29053 RepID=UPI0006C99C90|nr:uncharacterized protein LOC106641412 [Copidosoma floridanum]